MAGGREGDNLYFLIRTTNETKTRSIKKTYRTVTPTNFIAIGTNNEIMNIRNIEQSQIRKTLKSQKHMLTSFILVPIGTMAII